jgi:tyrosyl-tRNA synthetase
MGHMTTQPGSLLLDELAWRGLIHDSTDPAELRKHLDSGRRRFYIGFDPSAPSLTIGNLLPMTLIIRGALAGLEPVVVFGGGTGLIGDPSGKSVERSLLTVEETNANVARHQGLMAPIFDRALGSERMPEFVDNAEWLCSLSVLDFLLDVGRHFPTNQMIRRESVRRRLEDPEVGITYTEFSYALLQGYDFMRLFADRNVTLQLGASDQWGNITAGIDHIRRTLRAEAHGLTCPLLLRSDGTKFGKTEKGAIWISADRTPPGELYHFLLNLADPDARQFALYFSFEPREILEKLFTEHNTDPSRRTLQRHIAREITALLHGLDAFESAEAAAAGIC